MDELEGQMLVNGVDVWGAYGAFLVEEKRGGRENLTAILSPAKAKSHVGVNIREENGTKYSATLDTRSEERDVTLHFAIYARTRAEWLANYRAFIKFLKEGKDGWLTFRFPGLDVTLKMFYVDSTNFKPLTYLWKEGVQASRFKVKFREPEPSF
ncbi:MAG: hypothetical protein NC311_09065 [Muribaculaceae bacterium]|nr:hypothetical protein [Muribaculaceae bacterium]